MEFIPSIGEWDVKLRQASFSEPKSWWVAFFKTKDATLHLPNNSTCSYCRAISQSTKDRLEHQIVIEYLGHTYFVSSFGSTPVTISEGA